MTDYYRDEPRRRSSVPIQPGFNTTRRSWSNNGMHFTMQTTTYTSGGSFSSFGTGTGGATRSFLAPTRTSQPRAGGVLGAAFNLLGDVLATQPSPQQRQRRESPKRGTKQAQVEDDSSYSSDDDSESLDERRKPRGFVSKLAERIINNSQRPSQAQRTNTRSPVRSATKRPNVNGRSRSYRTEERQPSWTSRRAARVEDSSDDDGSESDEDDFDDFDPFPRRDSAQAFTGDQGRRGSAPHRTATNNARTNQPRRTFVTTGHIFTPSAQPAFEAFFGTRGPRRSPTMPSFPDDDLGFHTSFGGPAFAEFDRMFNDDFFFSLPRTSFAGASSTANNNPQQSRPAPTPQVFSTTPAASKPPRNLLKPEEAKKLFQTYNTLWNALAPIDPNIPYPCRGMKASALSNRDTLWAPLVSSAISTWSDETVMQANAQAFFLGVAGLTPKYTEAPGTGKIVMAYDKAKAKPDQVAVLIDMLKKEKVRWHSDRLGRRNGGAGTGVNEVLQRDERARAVFHAVCELMEVAQ